VLCHGVLCHGVLCHGVLCHGVIWRCLDFAVFSCIICPGGESGAKAHLRM
jgi:hypothetical protein